MCSELHRWRVCGCLWIVRSLGKKRYVGKRWLMPSVASCPLFLVTDPSFQEATLPPGIKNFLAAGVVMPLDFSQPGLS